MLAVPRTVAGKPVASQGHTVEESLANLHGDGRVVIVPLHRELAPWDARIRSPPV